MIDKRVVSCLSLKYKSNQDCNTRESVPLQMCWTLQFLPKNALLVVTINPFYRTPAFIARLAPVKNFTVHLSHVINSVIQVIHSNWSHIFGVKHDNLQVNKKAYETFYEIFDNLSVILIVHTYKSSKFEVLLILLDPICLFKNIQNKNKVTKDTLL